MRGEGTNPMESSKEARFEGLREKALEYLEQADRLEGQISLLEVKRLGVLEQIEGVTDREQTARLVREYEALTANMDELGKQQQEFYDKSADWRAVAKDLEGLTSEAAEGNQPA